MNPSTKENLREIAFSRGRRSNNGMRKNTLNFTAEEDAMGIEIVVTALAYVFIGLPLRRIVRRTLSRNMPNDNCCGMSDMRIQRPWTNEPGGKRDHGAASNENR